MPILVEHDTFNQTSLFDLQCFDKICVLLLAAYGCVWLSMMETSCVSGDTQKDVHR